VCLQQRLESGQYGGVIAELQLRVDVRLLGDQPECIQPGALDARPVGVDEVFVGMTTPHGQRFVEDCGGPVHITCGERSATRFCELLETDDSKLVGGGTEHVARRPADHMLGSERAAQARDVRLQRRHCVRRWSAVPDGVDEAVGMDGPIRGRQEHR
jgi:hypothetical protein